MDFQIIIQEMETNDNLKPYEQSQNYDVNKMLFSSR